MGLLRFPIIQPRYNRPDDRIYGVKCNSFELFEKETTYKEHTHQYNTTLNKQKGEMIMGLLDLLYRLAGSNGKRPSEMSDRELQRKLDSSVGKNTGESISSRASYIREGEKRGMSSKQNKK